MNLRQTIPSRFFTLLVSAGAALIIASCGEPDYGFGKRYPVTGKVTYNGQPLQKGSINFIPDGQKGAGASGTIDNGTYTMSTGGDGDGARPGKYKVTIISKEDTTEKAKADFQKVSGNASSGMIPRQYLMSAEAAAKSLIPEGYGDPRTTNLEADVKEQPNTIDFPLSDQDAPPAPPKTKAKGRRR
jgi:hypothetical protein